MGSVARWVNRKGGCVGVCRMSTNPAGDGTDNTRTGAREQKGFGGDNAKPAPRLESTEPKFGSCRWAEHAQEPKHRAALVSGLCHASSSSLSLLAQADCPRCSQTPPGGGVGLSRNFSN